jgi:AraC-like DNA-binding protein
MREGTRVLRHESELGSWALLLRRPAPALSRFVRDYEGYVESAAGEPVLRQQAPTTRIPFILNFGAPWRVADGTGESSVQDSFLAGLHDASAFVAAAGPASCVQVDFSPIGAHMLLGIPMDGLANRVVVLDDVVPSQLRHLPERLAAAPSWEARFAVLDEVLVARLADAKRPSPEIVWAWRELVRTHGRVRVATLARELGRSRRHLVARFREHVGLPPKTAARILRFNRAVRLLRRSCAPGFAALAFECGYYDQAHMNRDFREFTGTSPGEFARRLQPDAGVLA